jgi:hypothetical protein
VRQIDRNLVAEQRADFLEGKPLGLGEEEVENWGAEEREDDEDEVVFPADVGEGCGC